MGAWGTAIFSDDLAADIQQDFRDLIGDGLSSPDAVNRLSAEYHQVLQDQEDASVFWLALAAIQWRLGRLEEQTKRNALAIIDQGTDLNRWDDPADRKARAKVLNDLKRRLRAPQPAARRIHRRRRSDNQWSVGEVVAFRLLSGKWTLLRTIGHHRDKGGQSAICELLDVVTQEIPTIEVINHLQVRREASIRGTLQFLFQEPQKKADQERVVRLGLISRAGQKAGGYAVLVWPFVDRQMKEVFGLE